MDGWMAPTMDEGIDERKDDWERLEARWNCQDIISLFFLREKAVHNQSALESYQQGVVGRGVSGTSNPGTVGICSIVSTQAKDRMPIVALKDKEKQGRVFGWFKMR